MLTVTVLFCQCVINIFCFFFFFSLYMFVLVVNDLEAVKYFFVYLVAVRFKFAGLVSSFKWLINR